ncbi:sensor histidine kinase [Helicobacter kayseriensis]|uniref:sensor histidine kinase n=1 Tax=Helicobacter kayseriensis TaxID=2905877 RepID=UPI001E65BA53|nr:HAMP domain-containing sensor histidine kinase [Helicobacter kayseriensis]MCE3047623.1 HAMP domain-containing histidine kinase [Helicobacter kayseriensis]MCE3049025.1 HAMP domain-containing histidine kinase [Helicobacter kayseriensis]
MNEVKKTTLQILSLYLVSTAFFLSVIFGTWYFGEVNAIKTQSFYKIDKLAKRLINVLAKREEYANLQNLESQKSVLQEISLDRKRRIMVFGENGELVYDNMKFSPDEIPQENGIFIINNHVVLNSYGIPEFLDTSFDGYYVSSFGRGNKGADKAFRVVIDGGNIEGLLWNLRLKVWGIFGCAILMMGTVGYFLVRLSLRPLYQKIHDLDEFIKDTTHEINTPLSVLQMSIERINQDKIPQEEKKKLRYIQISAKTIENIYHSLVYSSFGNPKQEIGNVKIEELVMERLDFFSFLFEQKRIEIVKTLSPMRTMIDQKAMTLVLDNLLSNAYKYTPKGGEVQIFVGEDERGPLLAIQDSGYGIRAKDLEKIFHRYERLEHSGGGFGLGLSIVKKICDEFEIALEVESEYQKGSRFVLRWKTQNS